MKRVQQQDVRIRPNDILLFSRLCQIGCLTSKQITDSVFRNGSRRYTRERLKQLSDHGFIGRTNRQESLATSIYFPNPSKLVGHVSQDLIDRACLAKNARPWYGRFLEHDDLVRDYALSILEAYPHCNLLVDFQLSAGFGTSGSTFESGKRKVPDIEVTLEDGAKIFFEIERTSKSGPRYNEVFARYLLHNDFAVIYFYEDQTTFEKIVRKQEEVGLKGRDAEFPILFWPTKRHLDVANLTLLFESAKSKMEVWRRNQEIPGQQARKEGLKLSELLK